MTDKELLERLRAEVAAVTPDCWSGILARVQSPAQQPEEAPVVPMPERKRRSAWRGWVAAAAVFFLVILGGGLYATQVPGGVATLDANPSIELTVNKLGRVLSARACNPDAQLVLDESGAQPVYRVTLTTVYYFHPRYVVAVDQQTGTVLSVERSA